MCGIIAILVSKDDSNKQWLKIGQDLTRKMAHRGPDAERVEESGSVILGHRRLAILDLSDAGIQPMKSLDGRYLILLNGEIYNYLEIREELKEQGEEFHTGTDTEVLLRAFNIYGKDVLAKLNGMFSFIIWDNEKEELFIARDRFGIKPLYYTNIDGNLLFSSEIKPLLELLENPEPNYGIIFDFLVFSAMDHSDETFFADIQRFPAGHFLTIGRDEKITQELNFQKYWDIEDEVKSLQNNPSFKKKTAEEHITTVRKLFHESVNFRLRSDVKVGSCLSGGIDSASIVSTISKIIPDDTRTNYETFSMVYGEWFSLSEKKYIDIIANEVGFKANYITPVVDKINELFEQFLYYQEEPVSSLSPLGQFFVMSLARKCGTVVLLDGQGADEILAGYKSLRGYYLFELFRKFRLIRFTKEIWVAKRDFVAIRGFLAQFLPKFMRGKDQKRKRKKYFTASYYESFASRKSLSLRYMRAPLNKVLINELLLRVPHLLRWEDRNAMAFSIENRVPFLDHNFVSYVLALPPEYKITKGVTKWVFRESMNGITPQEILERRDKIGFAVPEKNWVNDSDLQLMNDLAKSIHPKLEKILSRTEIDSLLTKRENKQLNIEDSNLLFRLACLNKWFKIFFDKDFQQKDLMKLIQQ